MPQSVHRLRNGEADEAGGCGAGDGAFTGVKSEKCFQTLKSQVCGLSTVFVGKSVDTRLKIEASN